MDFFDQLSDGRDNLAQDAKDASRDQGLGDLVRAIETGLLRPMKAGGGKTPTISPHPRLEMEDSIDQILSHDLTPLSRDPSLRTHCLERDGYRCVVSGNWDVTYFQENKHKFPADTIWTDLECAHILPFALGSNPEPTESATIWTALRRYFPRPRQLEGDLTLGFTSEQINCEVNAMMLDREMHHNFGSYRFVLEATETLHTYHIKTFDDTRPLVVQQMPENKLIRLIANDGRHSLPKPYLL